MVGRPSPPFELARLMLAIAPVVTWLIHPNSPTTSLASMTIAGWNFGDMSSGTAPVVTLLDIACNPAAWISTTGVVCLTDKGIGMSTAGIRVTLEALVGTATGLFTFDGLSFIAFCFLSSFPLSLYMSLCHYFCSVRVCFAAPIVTHLDKANRPATGGASIPSPV